MIGLLPAFLLPCFAGWCVVRALLPPDPLPAARLLRLSLAPAVGLGLSSVGFFIAGLVTTPSSGLAIGVDTALLVGALLLMRLSASRARPIAIQARRSEPMGVLDRLIIVVFIFVAFVAVLVFIAKVRSFPHGNWDAWANWNLRGRFWFRGASHWQDMFSPEILWTSPRYPLLLSGTVARGWFYAGRELIAVPVITAALVTASTVAALGSGVTLLRNRRTGLLLATLLVAAPYFLDHGGSQYADAPLACLFLGTLIVIAIAIRQGESSSVAPLVLAGTLTGLAAWTKEEGSALAVVVIVATTIALASTHSRSSAIKRTWPLAAATGPFLAIALFVRFGLAPPTPDFYFSGGVFNRLIDFSRYVTIGERMIAESYRFGAWRGVGSALSVVLLVSLFALLRLNKGSPTDSAQKRIVGLALVGMLGADFLAYLFTQLDLAYHLQTSISRLLFVVWPVFLLLAGLSRSASVGTAENTSRSSLEPIPAG